MRTTPDGQFHLQTQFLFLLGATILGAFGLAWLRMHLAPTQSMAAAELLIAPMRAGLHPEPTERFVFAALAVSVPIAALLFARASTRSRDASFWHMAVPWLTAGLLFAPLFGSDFVSLLLGGATGHGSARRWALLSSLGVGAVWCLATVWLPKVKDWRLGRSTATVGAWLVFFVAALLQMLSWRVVGMNTVTQSGTWHFHADALFYTLSQVVAGKTLLVDLTSQYGLYPELLAPIFHLLPLSVASLTGVFGALQLASLLGLFFVMSKLVRSRLVLTVAGLALLLVTFETVLFFDNVVERYFQYWPLRFFWPAASVLAIFGFAQKPTWLRLGLVSVLGAIGTLWNADSGLFAVIAFGALLLARAAIGRLYAAPAGWQPRTYLVAAIVHGVVTVATCAAFIAMLRLKAGQPLPLESLVAYPKIFSDLGLAMMALPLRVHPWMSVLGLYLLSMMVAFNEWRRSAGSTRRADVVFYLSMLGLGLFIYYQGRSHISNLVNVSWPAILLTAILSDQSLRTVRARAAPKSQLALAGAGLAVLCLCAGSFLANSPKFIAAIQRELVARGTSDDPYVLQELALVKKHAPPGSSCLIAAYRQGIYAAEAGISSPFVGPGIVEMLLVADDKKLYHLIESGGADCLFYGTGSNSSWKLPIEMSQLLEMYDVADQSLGGTLLYLKRKPR